MRATMASEADALHRLIVAETAAKNLARADALALARCAEGHARQLASVCDGARESAGVERVLQAARECCAEAQDRLRSLSTLGGDANFADQTQNEALKQTLTMNQRRCAMLNDDMLRVAENNEELMSSLKTMKSTNRRLVDQIQSQSDDIEKLTKLRLADESAIEELAQKHRSEAQRWRRELDQQLETAKKTCENEFNERRAVLAEQLRRLRKGLRAVLGSLSTLRSVQTQAAVDIRSGLGEQGEELSKLARKLVERSSGRQRSDEETLARLGDEVYGRSVRVGAEREARRREAQGCDERDLELAAENDALGERVKREAQQLRADIDAVESIQEADAQGAVQKRSGRAEQVRDIATRVARAEAMLRGKQGTVAMLKERCKQGEAEYQQLEEEIRLARISLRELDTTLDQASADKEELRWQIEARRGVAHARRTSDVRGTYERLERLLVDQLACNQQVTSEHATRAEELGRVMAVQVAEVTRLQLGGQRRAAECAGLRRDCSLWRAQEELAVQLCNEVERELADGQNSWSQRIADLIQHRDAATSRQITLDEDVRRSKGGLEEFESGAQARAARARTAAAFLEAQLRETEEALASTKRALQEKVTTLAAARQGADAAHSSAVVERDSLEAQLRRVTAEDAEERERLAAEASAERQRAVRAQETCEGLRKQEPLALQEAHAEPLRLSANLEREIHDIREQHRAAMQTTDMRLQQERARVETLEGDVARAQGALDDAERRLQAETTLVRAAHAQGAEVRAQFDAELNAARTKAASSGERRGKIASDLEEALRHAADDVVCRERELAEFMSARARQSREAGARLEAARRQHVQTLAAVEDRHRVELDRHKAEVETAEAERYRLHGCLGGSGALGFATALRGWDADVHFSASVSTVAPDGALRAPRRSSVTFRT